MDNTDDNIEFRCSEHEDNEIKLIVDYCQHYDFKKMETDIERPLISKDPKIFLKD